MKFCINCGTQLEDDAKFCHSCGGASDATTEPPADVAAESSATPDLAAESAVATEPPAKKNGKEKLLNLRDKTVKFEKKHSLIVNLLVLCCSLVVLMVALFAPIKVSAYAGVGSYIGEGQFAYAEMDDGEAEYTFVEIDQTMFDMIGALFYISPDVQSLSKINSQMDTAMKSASSEYSLWRNLHPNASAEDRTQAQVDIYSKHISKTNYLGYLLANNSPFRDEVTDILGSLNASSDSENAKITTAGKFSMVALSVTLGFVVAVLAIVMAIMSLVNLIKAIVGMCKKKTIVKFDKYMWRMLALSGASLIIMMVSPLLATGGGMFGIALFISIVLLATSVLRSLFVRGDNWLGVIKRGVTAVLCMLAFFLLCSNIFVYSATYDNQVSNAYVKPGYAFYNMYSVIDSMDSNVNELLLIRSVVGLLMYIFTVGFIVSFSYKVYRRNLRNLVNGGGKPASALMIATAVLTLIGLVYGLISGTLIELMTKDVSGGEDVTVKSTTEWLMNGQVWAMFVLTIAAIALHFAFNPEKISKGKDMIVLPAAELGSATAAAAPAAATPAAEPVAEQSAVTEQSAEETMAEEPAAEEPAAEEPPVEQPVAEEQAQEPAAQE